jgi:hypothetical protein
MFIGLDNGGIAIYFKITPLLPDRIIVFFNIFRVIMGSGHSKALSVKIIGQLYQSSMKWDLWLNVTLAY